MCSDNKDKSELNRIQRHTLDSLKINQNAKERKFIDNLLKFQTKPTAKLFIQTNIILQR